MGGVVDRVKATHCFNHSIAKKTKPINTEAVIFLCVPVV